MASYTDFLQSAQYYWAYSWEYEANKEQYIDSVNLALTESHGNWDLFTTYQNWGDVVYLSQIPGGYGPAGGGKLAYWAIHSCEGKFLSRALPPPQETSPDCAFSHSQ